VLIWRRVFGGFGRPAASQQHDGGKQNESNASYVHHTLLYAKAAGDLQFQFNEPGQFLTADVADYWMRE
jgi:hypothetical protein